MHSLKKDNKNCMNRIPEKGYALITAIKIVCIEEIDRDIFINCYKQDNQIVPSHLILRSLSPMPFRSIFMARLFFSERHCFQSTIAIRCSSKAWLLCTIPSRGFLCGGCSIVQVQLFLVHFYENHILTNLLFFWILFISCTCM